MGINELHIFEYTGKDIYRDPSIENVIIGVIVFFGLLVHEHGHAFTSAYFGAEPPIALEAFGGYAEYNNSGMSRTKPFPVTLNGTLFQSTLIAVPYFLPKSGSFASYYYVDYILYVTMRLNIYRCLLNFIPIDPLDGGSMLRNLLEGKFGKRGLIASQVIGLVSVTLVVPYLYFVGQTFFSIFLLILGIKSFQKLKLNMQQVKVSPYSLYMRGEALNSNETDTAKNNFKELLKSKDTHLKHSAIEALAKNKE